MDSLYKTKKVDIFERVFFNYQWQFEKPIAQAGHFCNQTLYHLRLMKVALVCTNVWFSLEKREIKQTSGKRYIGLKMK